MMPGVIHTGHMLNLAAIFMATHPAFADAEPILSLTLFAFGWLFYGLAAAPSGDEIQRTLRSIRGQDAR